MTESTQLQLTYSHSNNSYSNAGSSGLFDYSTSTASASLSNQFDVYTKIFLQPSYSIYRVPATTYESKTKSYQVGITRTFTETTNATFSVGEDRTLIQQEVPTCLLSIAGLPCLIPGPLAPTSNNSSSLIYNASLNKHFEMVLLTVSASRSLQPSAIGQLERSDSLSFDLSRPFTEKLTGSLVASGYKVTANAGSTSTLDNRRSYQIQPNLNWQWTPECNIVMGYTYTHLQYAAVTVPVTDNAVYLTLTYQWPKISISR
ncbi:MAG: hypothetical protein ACYC9J_06050 [Sulfuricaulis sp.]